MLLPLAIRNDLVKSNFLITFLYYWMTIMSIVDRMVFTNQLNYVIIILPKYKLTKLSTLIFKKVYYIKIGVTNNQTEVGLNFDARLQIKIM